MIRVEDLSKKYIIGHQTEQGYATMRDAMANLARRLGRRLLHPFGGSVATSDGRLEEFWALRNVSFEVREGDVVGIIGRNGAGKSTLLKILSRITEPSSGRVRILGRVASLLEVGTGFHPELTGRENIFLNGAILGMTKEEIRRKFDEIVAFAEVDQFLDTPVKRYSSGMYVRLAFGVAAHLEPEILIVDEVLAVGDAQFQKKCLGKMSDVASEGRTVLFVSHNMAAVQSLCGRAIWLEAGKVKEDGDPVTLVGDYLNTSFTNLSEQVWSDISTAPGDASVRLRSARVRPESGRPGDVITINTPFVMEFEYWNLEPECNLNISLHIYNEQGIMAFGAAPINETEWNGRPFPVGLFRSACHIPGRLMNDGIHRIELLVVKNQGVILYRHSDILVFDIRDVRKDELGWHGRWPGAVRPSFDWSTEQVEEEPLAPHKLDSLVC